MWLTSCWLELQRDRRRSLSDWQLAPDGAGFKFADQVTFLDPAGTGLKDFRPFTLRPTADGRGFYVTDWGFSGWLTNAKVGRLWKVTYTSDDVKPAPRGKDSDSIEELLKEPVPAKKKAS